MLHRMLIGTALTAALGVASFAQAEDSYALDYTMQPAPVFEGPGQPATMPTPWTTTEMVPPTLDYNYYYPVPGGSVMPARLYQSPRPVPVHVGYTYITYQPFAPHHYLYVHRAAYISQYPGGTTVTKVSWGTSFRNHMRAFHCH